MTTTHENIAAALAAFQAEMPTVAKSKTARVPTKAGGSYSYTYADLADVTQSAMPLLARHGLSFITAPRTTETGRVLIGMLLHESGGVLEGELPIGGTSPQEIGSALTYMRRYLLGCLTGVVTDDDDDGTLSQQAAVEPRPRQSRPRTTRQQPTGPEPRPDGGITEHQLTAVNAALTGMGITERADKLTWISDNLSREVTSSKEVTAKEAGYLLDLLNGPEDGAA